MAEIVQKCRSKAVGPGFLVKPLLGRELVAARVDAVLERLHDVSGPDRVREARVFGTRKHERGEAKLPNTTEALDFGGIQERLNDPLRHALKGDQTVDRVPQDHDITLPPCP